MEGFEPAMLGNLHALSANWIGRFTLVPSFHNTVTKSTKSCQRLPIPPHILCVLYQPEFDLNHINNSHILFFIYCPEVFLMNLFFKFFDRSSETTTGNFYFF